MVAVRTVIPLLIYHQVSKVYDCAIEVALNLPNYVFAFLGTPKKSLNTPVKEKESSNTPVKKESSSTAGKEKGQSGNAPLATSEKHLHLRQQADKLYCRADATKVHQGKKEESPSHIFSRGLCECPDSTD